MRHGTLFWLAAGMCYAAAAAAAPQTLVSPGTRVSLLELYTSEGCDSCPPAEAWLSQWVHDDRLWKEVVAVAFHVDYWDDLGWKDSFGSSAYTARQQAIAAHIGDPTVYTPEFVLDGAEWRGFFDHAGLRMPEPSKVGILSLKADGRRMAVRFVPGRLTGARLEAQVALLAFGVDTHVGGGENAGAVLRHDFLVVAYSRGGMHAGNGGYDAELTLSPLHVQAARYALAAWVSPAGDPTPLQAVGGWTTAP